ncbi:MAG TPA: replication-relaxation family protein [Phycisphaerae bacterium]|nr:replication-relaxation family protein [Phycisphaerae bacterium]
MTLNKHDRTLLSTLAEYRIMSVDQIAALLQRNSRGLHRRIRALYDAGLVQKHVRDVDGRRGRPAHLVSLKTPGLKVLQAAGELPCDVKARQVASTDISKVEHQLMTNGFRIHLESMVHSIDQLTTEFLSPESPFRRRATDQCSVVQDRVLVNESSGRTVEFIPDGVFTITDQRAGKSLLFFLEVDRSTEPLTGNSPGALRQKIRTYQTYFATSGYKRYEEILGTALNGFRLLFFVDTPARLATVCRLVRGQAPRDFIWVSDEPSLFRQGLSDSIWVRGGDEPNSRESIIGPKLAVRMQLSRGD